MKKITIIIIILSMVLISGWRINKKNNLEKPVKIIDLYEKNGFPVNVIKAKRGNIINSVEISGTLEPISQVKIFSEISGVLKEKNFEIGDKINKDFIIAKIDDREFKATYLMADADLKIAKANLEKAKKGLRIQEVDAVKAGVNQAKANMERLQNDFLRLEKLYKNKKISKSQYDSAQKGYEAAKAVYEMANSKLSLAIEGTRSEDLKIIEASLQASKGRYALAELTYNKTIIKSPISGFIVSENYEKDDFVLPANSPAGKMLCEIIDIDKLYFVGYINELYLKNIKVGEKISIRIPAVEKNIEGIVVIINPMGDKKNRNYMIKVKLENSDHYLKPGMFSLGNLILEKVENVLIIPKDLIQNRKKNEGYIFINQNNIATKRIVKLGITEGENIEIISGIGLKDEIISDGIKTISEGVKIKVLDKEGK